MKKKKVDKIIKGVVTAGVALGGASFMTEADMVYAAETNEENGNNEQQEFEETDTNTGNAPEALEEAPAAEPAAPAAEPETPAAEPEAPAAPAEVVEDASVAQPEINNPEYDQAIQNLSEENKNTQKVGEKDWTKVREFVKDYHTAELIAGGASQVTVDNYVKDTTSGNSNDYYKYSYLDSEGIFQTEYVGYKTLDDDGVIAKVATKNLLIVEREPTIDESKGQVKCTDNYDELGTVQAGVQDFNGLKAELDDQLRETVANSVEKPSDDYSNAITELNQAMINIAKQMNKSLIPETQWDNWRVATTAYAKANIIANGGTITSVGQWTANDDVDNHYVKIDYTDAEGNEKSGYYDYVCQANNGKLDKNHATQRAIVIEKTPEVISEGNVVKFASYEGDDISDDLKGMQNEVNEMKKGRSIVKLSTITSDLLRQAISELDSLYEKNKPVPAPEESPVVTDDDNVQPGTDDGVQNPSQETDQPAGGTTDQTDDTTQQDEGTSSATDTTQPQAQETRQIPAGETAQAPAPAQNVTTINNTTVPAAAGNEDNTNATGNENASPAAGGGQEQNASDNNGAGQTQEGQTTTLNDGQVPLAVKTEPETVNLSETKVPQTDKAPVETDKISWLWLLIIALLGATGKKMYDEHQKKIAAKAEANNLDK